MRKPPHDPPIVERQQDDKLIIEVRRYKVITPLFGGGVEPGEADPITVVRATEVRGHLRFWWRATRGGAYGGDLAEMRKAEDLVWGSSGEKGRTGPSDISIVVSVNDEGDPDHPFEIVQDSKVKPRKGSEVNPYAGFPLQPQQDEAKLGAPTKSVRTNVSFILEIRYPRDHKPDVEAALWSWETFGGLGARTRRGFGALQCVQVNDKVVEYPGLEKAEARLKDELAQYLVTGKWPPHVPHVSTDMRHYRLVGHDTPPKVWNQLIQALREFRQDPSGRRPGNQRNQPGRSYWPEPEAIRRLTDQRHLNHPPLGKTILKFPRARFGLPIIFHFKDANRRNPLDKASDPHDTTLQGADDIERLASPVILKPLPLATDKAIGLVAILLGCHEPPHGLVLKTKRGDLSVDAKLLDDEAREIPPLAGKKDVLMAFLQWLDKRRF